MNNVANVTQNRGAMKILAARPAITGAAVLTSFLWFAIQGCGIPFGVGVKNVPVQEVDRHGTSLARLGKAGPTRGSRANSIIFFFPALTIPPF